MCIVFAVLSEHMSSIQLYQLVWRVMCGIVKWILWTVPGLIRNFWTVLFFSVLTGFTWYSMLSPCDLIHLSWGIMPWLEHLLTSPVWNSASVACDYSWILLTWNLHIFLPNLSFRKRKAKCEGWGKFVISLLTRNIRTGVLQWRN